MSGEKLKLTLELGQRRSNSRKKLGETAEVHSKVSFYSCTGLMKGSKRKKNSEKHQKTLQNKFFLLLNWLQKGSKNIKTVKNITKTFKTEFTKSPKSVDAVLSRPVTFLIRYYPTKRSLFKALRALDLTLWNDRSSHIKSAHFGIPAMQRRTTNELSRACRRGGRRKEASGWKSVHTHRLFCHCVVFQHDSCPHFSRIFHVLGPTRMFSSSGTSVSWIHSKTTMWSMSCISAARSNVDKIYGQTSKHSSSVRVFIRKFTWIPSCHCHDLIHHDNLLTSVETVSICSESATALSVVCSFAFAIVVVSPSRFMPAVPVPTALLGSLSKCSSAVLVSRYRVFVAIGFMSIIIALPLAAVHSQRLPVFLGSPCGATSVA